MAFVLHPDLDSLRSQYNQVLDELEAGNLSYDDALSSVQAMSVVDGGGFIWLIDTATGGFLRAVPGVQEVSIGHALIGDALELGYAATVEAYQAVIATAFERAPG